MNSEMQPESSSSTRFFTRNLVRETVRKCLQQKGEYDKLEIFKHSAEFFFVCRVTTRIRQGREEFFTPAIVSIGPVHHDKEHLKAMENHKLGYLHDFLQRKPDIELRTYVEAIVLQEYRALTCYFEYHKFDRGQFVTMLLLDACFIIEFLNQHFEEDRPGRMKPCSWIVDQIWEDLLLLENQIPFFIVKCLCDLQGHEESEKVALNAAKFFIGVRIQNQLMDIEAIEHLLHLYHHYTCYQLIVNEPTERLSQTSLLVETDSFAAPIECATKLVMSGVKLRKKESRCRDTDVSFDYKNGVLEIPPFKIDQPKRSRLINLVAYEQCIAPEKIVSSYVQFLSYIITTRDDLEILQKKDIVTSHLRNNEDAVNFFNCLNTYIYVDPSDNHLLQLYRDIKKYTSSWFNRNIRGILWRVYFANIWVSMSVAAAVLLLIAGILQAIFTIYPYFHHHPFSAIPPKSTRGKAMIARLDPQGQFPSLWGPWRGHQWNREATNNENE